MEPQLQGQGHLHILWTNADPLTAQLMVMMYATNCMLNHWWDAVTVIIWGATAKLAAEDGNIQTRIQMAQHAGVRFSACLSCARQLGVTEALEAQGIELIYWGEDLTKLLRQNHQLLTI